MLSDTLRLTLLDLFECAPAFREGVRVSKTKLYPDGGAVDVFVLERDELPLLADRGPAIGWLRMQSVAERLSDRTRELIGEVCETRGVALERGRLVFRSEDAVLLDRRGHLGGLEPHKDCDDRATWSPRLQRHVPSKSSQYGFVRPTKLDITKGPLS